MANDELFKDANDIESALRAQGFRADEHDLKEILLRVNGLVEGLLALQAAHTDLPEGLGSYNGWWASDSGK